MRISSRKFQFNAIALALALGASALHAQMTQAPSSSSQATGNYSAYDANRASWIPYTRNGYMGLNLGRSNFGTSCGNLALRCDNSDTSGHFYLGGYFNPYLGAEIGYVNLGDIQRAGGSTEADGVNLSLVARAPLASNFSLYGKLGATYGRTRVSAAAGSGVVSGREHDWGGAYALGASYNFSSNWSAVLEWNRTRFNFAGNDREWVRSTSLGLQYRF